MQQKRVVVPIGFASIVRFNWTGKGQVLECGLLDRCGPHDRGGGAFQRRVSRARLLRVAGSLLGLEGLRRLGEGAGSVFSPVEHDSRVANALDGFVLRQPPNVHSLDIFRRFGRLEHLNPLSMC